MAATVLVSIISLHILLLTTGVKSATLIVANRCGYTVWPALFSRKTPLSTTGYELAPGASVTFDAPADWSGRVWGRTLCATDPATHVFKCATGDCGSGSLQCDGKNAVPPVTLVEFTMDGSGGMDFYDVSLVDGYNLPVEVLPQLVPGNDQGGGKCEVSNCPVDVNMRCPPELSVKDGQGRVLACMSACEAFHKPEYCCTESYITPQTCPPTSYSKLFKDTCPRAYSFAYDDATSTFTCASGTHIYVVSFCPSGGGGSPPSHPSPSTSAAAPRTTPIWF